MREAGKAGGGTGWEAVFSGPRRTSSTSLGRQGSAVSSALVGDEEDDDEDDEALGPSPVKPSSKAFAPLLAEPSAPALFTSSVKSLRPAPRSMEPDPITTKFMSNQHPTLAPVLRGVKRTSTTPLPFDHDMPSTSKISGAGDGEDDGKDVKGKKKKVVKPRKVKRAKLLDDVRGDEDEDVEMDVEGDGTVVRRRGKGGLVLEIGEEGAKGTITIHPRRPYFSSKGKERDVDGEGEDEEDDMIAASQGSLFYRDEADLLASQDHTRRGTSVTDDFDDEQDQPSRRHGKSTIDVDPSIPSDLVSMLSLRSSPLKKTSMLREKDRDLRVKRLLQEPSVTGPKKKGLADLDDEVQSGSDDQRGGEEGSDDDWASDAEGWKDLGDGAMDGYDDSS